jgi:hypothetical protein
MRAAGPKQNGRIFRPGRSSNPRLDVYANGLERNWPRYPNRIRSPCLSMIFPENRFAPIGATPEGMLFRIMR